jgi:hypothetical protein
LAQDVVRRRALLDVDDAESGDDELRHKKWVFWR